VVLASADFKLSKMALIPLNERLVTEKLELWNLPS